MDKSPNITSPVTPKSTRTSSTIPPFSPRTPLRRPNFSSNDNDDELSSTISNTSRSSLVVGCNLLVRGIGAKLKDSDPVQLMENAIVKICKSNPSLVPVNVKPLSNTPTRKDWSTSCYIHLNLSSATRASEKEPRVDLLILWMAALAAYNSNWEVAWTPCKPGSDKRMFIRFLDVSDDTKTGNAAATDKIQKWATTKGWTVASIYAWKNAVCLTLASPKDVDEIASSNTHIIKGFEQPVRAYRGRQIEIQNPFELAIIGAPTEYDTYMLEDLISKWISSNFCNNGESTLAGYRTPPGEPEIFVFHMTTWAATTQVLSIESQQAFLDFFKKLCPNMLAPQLLFDVNGHGIFKTTGNLRNDFKKGAESLEKAFQALDRRVTEYEKANQTQHLATQLQISGVTAALTEVHQGMATIQERVTNTQHALIAQNHENMLERNLAEVKSQQMNLRISLIGVTDQKQINDANEIKAALQISQEEMERKIKTSRQDFTSIVSSPAANVIQSAPSTTIMPSTPPGVPRLTIPLRRSSATLTGIPEGHESHKKPRTSSQQPDQEDKGIPLPKVGRMMDIDSNEQVCCPFNQSPNPLTAANDGTPESMMKPIVTRPRMIISFRGVLDSLKDFSGYRRSRISSHRSKTTNMKPILLFTILLFMISLLNVVQAASAPLSSTSTISIYALNANGLVQAVKVKHVNDVINLRHPHAFVLGETKTKTKLSKSLPFLDYDIHEEAGESAENHHIFKWGIVMGIRKDLQIAQRVEIKQRSLKGRVIAVDVILPTSDGKCFQHRLIAAYAPWNPGAAGGDTNDFWTDMTSLCRSTTTSWSLAGDLNATIAPFERLNGGVEARRQYLQFLRSTNGHDLWSNNPDRTRVNDWTCRSSQAGQGNIIDRVVTSTSTLTDAEISVTDRSSDWVPKTDHRGILARIMYSRPPMNDDQPQNDATDLNFQRRPSSSPRIKMPLKTEKDKYQVFRDAVDEKIEAKLLSKSEIIDHNTFIKQYKDLTSIITLTALNVFGRTKAFVKQKQEITNDKIKGIINDLRSVGGAIRFEKSNQTTHVSPKALEYHTKALRNRTKSGGSIHDTLTRSRKLLHKNLYAETSKEIVHQAKEADKRRIAMALRGSTKKMIQSSSYVPLPLAVNDLDEPERLICDPEGVKATTHEYFNRLYDHTRIPELPKPWMETLSVTEVKARVLNDPFQWPKKTTLADFRAMIRRGNNRPSPGPDKWEKWTIKSLSDTALSLVLDLHNYQVMNSCFPGTVKDLWLTTIYKKGLRTDLRNWRGLCFSNFLANSPMTWLNQNLIRYAADKHILPDTQVAAQPGVQTRDLMSYLAGVKCWTTRHKQPVYAIKRDQMKGFDYLSPDGFYDAIKAYGLPHSIITLDKAAQNQVKCFIHTAYGATLPITVSGVSKQGGPVSPLKSTFTTSMGHYYLSDILSQDETALVITSATNKRKDPHTPDACVKIQVVMVEATDDTYIFSKTLDSLQRNTLEMERFQYAYGWLTQWSKSNAYILAPEKETIYPDEITFQSVSVGQEVDPMIITEHKIALIKDDLDFLRTKIDNPAARFEELKAFIDAFQFPKIMGRLPITLLRKIVSQNVISKCRALLSLQPITIADAEKLDKAIMHKVHDALGFPFHPTTDIATLPISQHGFGFPSIVRINAALAIDGLSRDLNHHIPAYRDMAKITLADWTCEKNGCQNPLDGPGLEKDQSRRMKAIPSSWIVAQKSMRQLSLTLKATDQSYITRGDVSLSHVLNICNHKIPQKSVNGTTLLSLRRLNILLLKDIGKWIIDKDGYIVICPSTPNFTNSWTTPARLNWAKVTDLISQNLSINDLTAGMIDLTIPRHIREQNEETRIRGLANTSNLPPSEATDGKTWASDGSMVPATASLLDPKQITGAVTGKSALVMRVPGRNVSILQGEQIGLIMALVLSGRDDNISSDEHQRLLTDHLNSVHLVRDNQTSISQVPRLRYMNGRSYYRWILSLHKRRKVNIEYTPGHAKDNTLPTRMNNEADQLATSSQKRFEDLPTISPPTFYMNEYTFHHDTDGWIESSIPHYIDIRMIDRTKISLGQGHSHRMSTWAHDDTPPPEYPYNRATSAHSAAVQLYARSGQLATADTLYKRNKIDDDKCRLGCEAIETSQHLFVDCQRYTEWREGATEEIIKKTELKLDTMGIEGDTREKLSEAAKSLFIDDPDVWPLHKSMYYLGQLPKLDNFISNDSKISSILKRRLKSHLASDWHTTAIRLAGRIFGDFQKRMAAKNNCPSQARR